MASRLIGPVLLFAAGWAALWELDPFNDVSITDIYIYEGYASEEAAPYTSAFEFEYPPLALVPIRLAQLLGGTYETTFGLLMGLAGLAVLVLAAQLGGAKAAWVFALTPFAAGAVLRTHYDLVAAATLLAALLAFDRRRPTAGFALLGLGAMVKGFPLVLAPIALAWTWVHAGRRPALTGVAVLAAVVVVISAPFLGGGYVDAYRFHVDRPVQIESTPAVVLYALGGSTVTGTDTVADEFNSNGLVGGAADVVQALFGLLAFAVLALLAWLATRQPGPRHLVMCLIAGVVAFVALGKVLSPQYIAWLAPLAAVLLAWRERMAAALLAVAVVLTQVEFPSRYQALVGGDDVARVIVAGRNAALLAALGFLIARAAAPARWPRHGGAVPSSAPPRP